jgi:hypothetical protein
MDENVFSGLALDETKALASIKPLHCSLFFHDSVYLFSKKLFGASLSGNLVGDRASFVDSPDTAVSGAGNKKRPQVHPATLYKKGETRATNA